MDIMLVFSLLLIQDLSQQGHKTYDCHMQNYAEIFPENTKSISIILKESEKATREELTRNHVVATLQCSGAKGPVEVRLIVSEKKYRSRHQAKRLLQSLTQATDQDERGCAAQCCLFSANSKRSLWRQAEISLVGKVLLPEVSHCTIGRNETKYGNVTERAEMAKKINVNATCGPDPDEIQIRKKISLFLKIAILCVLIPVVIAFMVLIVCEVPCPHSCPHWMPKLDGKASEKKMTKITSLASLGTSTTAKV